MITEIRSRFSNFKLQVLNLNENTLEKLGSCLCFFNINYNLFHSIDFIIIHFNQLNSLSFFVVYYDRQFQIF